MRRYTKTVKELITVFLPAFIVVGALPVLIFENAQIALMLAVNGVLALGLAFGLMVLHQHSKTKPPLELGETDRVS